MSPLGLTTEPRLVYLANLRVPSEKAHVLQTFKNCEAFAAMGLDVLLAHPRRRRTKATESVEDPFEYYGVRTRFAIREVPCPDLLTRSLPPPLSHAAFILHSQLFTRRVLRGEDLSRPEVLLYTRDFFAATFLSVSGYRFVFEVHTLPRGPVGTWMRFLARHSVGLVVITRELERELLVFGIPGEKILVAPDAVDERWIDETLGRGEARRPLEIQESQPLVIYSGHLYSWKGIDTLLDAATRLPHVHFRLLGGMARDVERVEKRVRELGLGNVRLEGHVAHRRVPAYLAAADALVLPNSGRVPISARHTSPLKAFEYMAAGRPIVASDLPSLREIFENEVNALLVPPDDGAALARGIARALSDGTLAARLAAEARRRVRSHTWRRRAEAIHRFARERGGWSRLPMGEAVRLAGADV
jgi:glycosyltransferase involved in cell wall biosynthesis